MHAKVRDRLHAQNHKRDVNRVNTGSSVGKQTQYQLSSEGNISNETLKRSKTFDSEARPGENVFDQWYVKVNRCRFVNNIKHVI